MTAWKDAEKEFESWFTQKNQYCCKIEDHLETHKLYGDRNLKVQTRPSDFIVVDQGVMFFAEVKSCKNETSFPFANIKVPQWHAARRTVAAGGQYYFFLKNEVTQQWYRVPAELFVSMKFEMDMKSVKWDRLSTYLKR